MTVENFWRFLKHETLHHLLHPRLDQLVWLLVTEVSPQFDAKMRKFGDDYRPGRSRELSPFQKAFKANWQKLQQAKIDNIGKYMVNVEDWTCTCGQQKYNTFVLCKHLVQSVEDPPPRFFQEVVRRRVIPFYRHPLLVVSATKQSFPDIEDGCITDGDDRPKVTGTVTSRKRTANMAGVRTDGTEHHPAQRRRLSAGDKDDPIEILRSSSPIEASDAEDDEVS